MRVPTRSGGAARPVGHRRDLGRVRSCLADRTPRGSGRLGRTETQTSRNPVWYPRRRRAMRPRTPHGSTRTPIGRRARRYFTRLATSGVVIDVYIDGELVRPSRPRAALRDGVRLRARAADRAALRRHLVSAVPLTQGRARPRRDQAHRRRCRAGLARMSRFKETFAATLPFRDATFPWWIAGGHALDLAVATVIRPRDDLDVAVLSRDQRAVRSLLGGPAPGVRRARRRHAGVAARRLAVTSGPRDLDRQSRRWRTSPRDPPERGRR